MSLSARRVFFDAGMFVGALNRLDPRFAEAQPLVAAAMQGNILAGTSVGVLSEVYAALTWVGAKPPLSPQDAAEGVRRLVETPSAISVISDGVEAALLHLRMADRLGLTARRIHDARHAATALVNEVTHVYTYDPSDWSYFVQYGITIAGPPSTLANLAGSRSGG